MGGVGAIIWKEWRELLLPNGRPGKQVWGLLALEVAMPVFFGFMFGFEPIAWAIMIGAIVGMMPIFTVLAYVIDSFAGERERHTLETLLATELTDTQILMGKLLALISFGFVFGAAGIFVILIAAPIYVGTGEYFALALVSYLASFVGAMHYAVLGSLVGILISMRVSTVRLGQQVLAYTTFLPFMLIAIFLPSVAAAGLIEPERFVPWLPVIAIGGALAVYGTMALLFFLALRMFRRERLLSR